MTAWTDRSEQIDLLAAALVKALGEMNDIARTKQASIPTKSGGSYGYRYADLGDTLQSIRPVLATHGLAVTQTAATIGDEVAISTTLLHASGQFVTAAPLTLPVGKTAQETGSAITYARRYALMAVVGLAADDDDGASAAPRSTREAPRSAPERRTPSRSSARASEPRSDAEREIRALLATLTGPEATRVKAEFKAAFGSTLADLDADLHEVALTWMKEAVEIFNAADAAWVQEAQQS